MSDTPLMLAGNDARRQRCGSITSVRYADEAAHVTEEHYPMFVLPTQEVLGMDELLPHQTIMDKLIKYDPEVQLAT